MAWYRTGTVTVTNGSTTVTGSGTAFIANVSIGEAFLGPDGRAYEITNVASDTSLTISPNYQGSTAGGQGYAILPARGRIADLIAETQNLLASFANVRDGIGAGLFPNGSQTTPAFRFANDQDTGIYLANTNTIGFATSGAARAFFGENGSLWLRPTTSAVKSLVLSLGSAASGAATAFDFLTSDVSSVAELVVKQTRYTGTISFRHESASGEQMSMLFNNSPADHFISLYGPEGSNTVKTYISGTGSSYFSNSVGVGTTAPSNRFHVSAPNGDMMRLQSSGGQSLYFYGDDANLGLFNAAGAGGERDGILITNNIVRLEVNATSIAIATSAGLLAGVDGGTALGAPSNRWNTVYAATGTINTSDEREKHWRGELSPAELRAAKRIIGELGIYQWNDAVAEKGEDGARLHFGVRAQQAFAIMEDEGLDWGRYAWACYDQWEEQTEPVMEEVTVTKTRKVMRPSTLIDPATGQPAMVEVDEAYEETEMRPTGETRVTLEAGDRYGVRPDQLAFWLIAAQAAVQADLEARLATLETA